MGCVTLDAFGRLGRQAQDRRAASPSCRAVRDAGRPASRPRPGGGEDGLSASSCARRAAISGSSAMPALSALAAMRACPAQISDAGLGPATRTGTARSAGAAVERRAAGRLAAVPSRVVHDQLVLSRDGSLPRLGGARCDPHRAGGAVSAGQHPGGLQAPDGGEQASALSTVFVNPARGSCPCRTRDRRSMEDEIAEAPADCLS